MVDLPHRLGKYTLNRRIGSGGMGRVYLATLEGTGGFSRDIALKLIRAELASSARGTEMFLREGRALAALSHRNVVQVFELDREGDQLYLAMEYLRGLDLGQIRARGPLGWQAAVFIASEAARGLAAAHAARSPDAPSGIVHGDISPSNVMACFDGAVKVLDFGLARPVGLAAASGVGGKLPYLPPEVLVGGAPDEQTDIYGLGLVLHELLTGQRVYKADNDADVIRRVMHDPIHAPSTRVPGLPPALDQLVLALVSRDRAVRPSRATDVADTLDRILDGRFGAADLATLVTGLVEQSEHMTREVKTPLGRTEAFDAAGGAGRDVAGHGIAGRDDPARDGAPHTMVATASDVAVPRRRGRWIAGIASIVAIAAGLAVWQLTARDSPSASAAAATEQAETVVPMQAAPAEGVPAVAPEAVPQPAAQPAPEPSSPPVATQPKRVVHKQPKPRPTTAAPPTKQAGSGSISPGYIANPFEKK